jgi:CubicO group peptidase (beta-lactamase class C family)
LSAVALSVALFFGLQACGPDPVGPHDSDPIEALMRLYQVPGVSIAVIKDFKLAYVETHGVKSLLTSEPVTSETLFQAASLSKSVSAVGIARLAQEGVVSLDADVDTYLTSWHIPDNSYQTTERVTLRRLLSHTAGTTVSGFRGYRYTESVPTLIQVLNGEPPSNSPAVVVDFVPGSRWRYSGGGFVIAGLTVEDVTGVDFGEFMRAEVLEPIGMTRSTYEQPLPEVLRASAPSGYYADGTPVPGGHHIYPEIAAASLWTTPSDMARFLIELQLSLRGESNKVLSRNQTEVLLTAVMNDWALGFPLSSRGGQPYFGHEGANDGFRCAMLAHRTSGDGAVIMTNSDRGDELYRVVFQMIGEREGWPGF